MSEREFFIENIPFIAEMAAEVDKMSLEQYKNWKRETLNQAQQFGEAAAKFMKEVIIIIETTTWQPADIQERLEVGA